jgi:low temperature requirement protein LtrA
MSAAGHRRVTWMELFFDLIFVAAVAEAAKPFAADYSAAGLLRFSFLFTLIWFAWSGHTLYATRFDRDDFTQRAMNLVQCFIAAVMAANAKDALDSRSSAGFSAAYAGIRLVLAIQYLRARKAEHCRQLAGRFAAGSVLGITFWISAALSPAPARFVLWGIALAIDLATPLFAERYGRHLPPHAAHFPERFGLFTIILLGEFVADVMRGIERHEEWSVPAASTAFMGMAAAFALWWWYFDGAQGAADWHAQSPREWKLFHVWQHVHPVCLLGIATAGIGFKHLIALRDGGTLHHGEAMLLCLSVCAVMLSVIAIGWTRGRVHWEGQIAIFSAAAALTPFASHLPKTALAGALLSACALQTAAASAAAPGASWAWRPAPGFWRRSRMQGSTDAA